ncbi:MAG TPA: hypothetical protein VKX41_20000 [Alloacidobacterium sp.]|jgi:hypothetical protein|nr:hypothetical protein [Alloacidobacterium sp.]
MRVLYVVFVLSIVALIWTAVAVARHIRKHEAQREQQVLEEPEVVGKSDSE